MVSDIPGPQFWLFTSCVTSVSSSVKYSYLPAWFEGEMKRGIVHGRGWHTAGLLQMVTLIKGL